MLEEFSQALSSCRIHGWQRKLNWFKRLAAADVWYSQIGGQADWICERNERCPVIASAWLLRGAVRSLRIALLLRAAAIQ
jgi:hypothetical protein